MRRSHLVDVFSTVPFGGNPLAVVLDARGMTDEQMQQVTRWMNHSESAFLLPPTEPRADYRVRWGCPGPNATVARLWVLAGEREVAKVDLQCKDGGKDEWTVVPVEFRLANPARIRLRVVYVAGEIWHDVTTVTAR